MRKKYIYSTIIAALFSLIAVGQEKQLARADKEFDDLSYVDARDIYLKVAENGYESKDLYAKLADSYYFNADLPSSVTWYTKLYNKYKSDMEPEYLFRYAQSLKSVEKYKESDVIMEDYNKATGRSGKVAELFDNERNYLDLIAKQSGRFEIKNLQAINTSGSDFGSSLYKDNAMVYASAKKSTATKVLHEWNEHQFLDLYETQRVGANSMNVEGVDKLNSKVNTKLHESTTAFTADGKTMYFTRNNLNKSRTGADNTGTILLKLFKAEKLDNGKWGNIEELPFNSDNYSVAHPALSPDEKKLYFASDMPGTKGLSDLFVVDILGGNKYSEPKNLGEGINTEVRETFPFVSESGKLFFASDGHIGLGGLDVFVAIPDQTKGLNKYMDPINVGKPVNSEDDDFAFVIEEKSKIGYFTSNRSGGQGSDDIYSLKQNKDLILRCEQSLEGIITDATTKEVMPNALVTLYDANMKKLGTDTADEKGRYEFKAIECESKYVVRAQEAGYKPSEQDFTTDNRFDYVNNVPLALVKGDVLAKEEVKLGDDLAKILQLEPIYFDFDKSYIRPDAEIELQKVIAAMKQYPALKIDVRSHTDSRAPAGYNESLSTRRNKSTIQYIIDKGGISAGRLTGRGYGERELTNRCADGVPCSEQEHQLNRRSEFIILEK